MAELNAALCLCDATKRNNKKNLYLEWESNSRARLQSHVCAPSVRLASNKDIIIAQKQYKYTFICLFRFASGYYVVKIVPTNTSRHDILSGFTTVHNGTNSFCKNRTYYF